MNSSVLGQYVKEEIIANDPWTDDATLYQPYEAEQILLAENASCLAVKAYLKMCDLPFNVKSSANAEFMSPGGRMTKLPFVHVGAFVVAEFEPIVNLVENKGVSLSNWLDEDQKSDMRAYISLVENIFTNAELYVSFVDDVVLKQVTYPRNGCVYPWPLNIFENMRKRRNVLRHLNVYNWKNMSMEEVAQKVGKCCETLAEKLGNDIYFYGNRPTELDAVTFGHLFTILTTKLPNNILAEKIKEYKPLVRFCQNIDKKYFNTINNGA